MASFLIKRGLEGVVVLLVFACSASASLVTDGNGMGGDWQGTETFQSTNNKLYVDVEFCVYAPTKFSLSFPEWTDPTGGTHYVYAYQIFNDEPNHPLPEEASPVRYFTVGLNDGDEGAANLGHLVDDPNHKNPTGVIPPGDSARWNFADPNDIEYDYVSSILFYTSLHAPQVDDQATVGGSGTAKKVIDNSLPSPAPEPATVGLLGAGLLALVNRRARRKE